MRKRTKRSGAHGITPEYAMRNLLDWNPHWSRHSLEKMTIEQLFAVYYKERTRVVKLQFERIGAIY